MFDDLDPQWSKPAKIELDQFIASIIRKFGGIEKCRKVMAVLRSVTDHQDFLRRVAQTSAGSRTLIASAVLGLSLGTRIAEKVEKERTPDERSV